MARPIKLGLSYFPLDVDMDQDDKITMIEAIHGIEGFGIVIKILSKIYKEGYYYEWTKREQILFSKRINVDINLVSEVVNDCIKESLFNENLYNEYQILTSSGIQSRYLEAIKRRKKITLIKEYLLISEVDPNIIIQDLGGNRVNVDINSEDADNKPSSEEVNERNSTQRKEKKIKEKNNKQKQSENVVVENPFNFYENNFSTLNPFVSENIGMWIDDLSGEVVIEAMKLAVMNNARNWKYCESILKNWITNNIKTLDDVQAYTKDYERNKQNRTGSVKTPTPPVYPKEGEDEKGNGADNEKIRRVRIYK